MRVFAALALSVGVVLSTLAPTMAASDPADYDVPNGHFYTQTNGTELGAPGGGYTVTDADGIPFWSYLNQHGGVDLLGYPISQRYSWDGYVCQATQRAILQWNPANGTVQLANVFDYLSQAGRDDWLLSAHLAPKAEITPQEQQNHALPFLVLAHFRFAWLYTDSAIFHRYFNTPDYYTVYGLPTSSVHDLGPYYALRTQRAVLYHWKSPVPWADDRGVSVGLAGDFVKELGMIPAAALRPLKSPNEPSSGLPSATSPKTNGVFTPAVATTGSTGGRTSAPSQTAQQSPNTDPAAGQSSGLPVYIGVATWYGADFQGQEMANGEIYDMYNAHIAAANLYPLGTWLRVTRLSTGDSVVVRVTDRGAFSYPDITDLSYAAFSQLADPASGVIGVRVEPLN